MRRTPALALACLAAAVIAPPALAAPTAIDITSPAAGSTVSRAASTLAVKGTSAFDAVVPAGRTFYLRGTGCGATEDLWLSVSRGSDEYDGCGIIGGVPLNETGFVDAKVLDARDGVPAKLDASQPLKGVIRAESWFGDGVPGAGQVAIDVAVSGSTAGGDVADLGSTTVSAVNDGKDGVDVPFSLTIPAEHHRAVLTGLSLSVHVRGVNYNSSNLGMDGASKLTLPILDEGAVQISDSPAFTASKTRTVLPGADGTWAGELPMPAAGPQTVYARAVQGTTRLSAAPVSFTVAP